MRFWRLRAAGLSPLGDRDLHRPTEWRGLSQHPSDRRSRAPGGGELPLPGTLCPIVHRGHSPGSPTAVLRLTWSGRRPASARLGSVQALGGGRMGLLEVHPPDALDPPYWPPVRGFPTGLER